jgi:hypothetical protein
MAAQNLGLHSHIMAPQIMGYLMPNISVMEVLNIFSSPPDRFAHPHRCDDLPNQNRLFLSIPFVVMPEWKPLDRRAPIH